jgi:hypothetical protein
MPISCACLRKAATGPSGQGLPGARPLRQRCDERDSRGARPAMCRTPPGCRVLLVLCASPRGARAHRVPQIPCRRAALPKDGQTPRQGVTQLRSNASRSKWVLHAHPANPPITSRPYKRSRGVGHGLIADPGFQSFALSGPWCVPLAYIREHGRVSYVHIEAPALGWR